MANNSSLERYHKMRTTKLAQITNPVSVIGLGTMVFHPKTIERDHDLLSTFVENGGTFIDTAEIYGAVEQHGYSEIVIGEWLAKNAHVRDSIVLGSKGLIPGTCSALHPGGASMSADTIEDAISGSLDRLKTDHLDVWMFHRDDPSLDVGPLVEALAREVTSGRILAYGASNWSTSRIADAIKYADEHGLPRMSAASPQYSLAKPNEPYWPETVATTADDEKWYSERDLLLVAWSSLGRGFFAKGEPDSLDDQDLVRVFYSNDNFERKSRAQALSKERNISMFEVALAYVTNQLFPTVALAGSVSAEEVLSSVAAGDIELSRSEREWLNLESDQKPF